MRNSSKNGRRDSNNFLGNLDKNIFSRPLTRKTFDVRNLDGKKSENISIKKSGFSADKLTTVNIKAHKIKLEDDEEEKEIKKTENNYLTESPKKDTQSQSFLEISDNNNFLPDVSPEILTQEEKTEKMKREAKRKIDFHFESLSKITTPGKMDGYPKTNQDSAIIVKMKYSDLKTNYFTSDILTLLAVFDGHGNNGHHVSGFITQNFRSNFFFYFLDMFKQSLRDLMKEVKVSQKNGIEDSKDTTLKSGRNDSKEKSLTSVIQNNMRSHLNSEKKGTDAYKEIISKLQINYYELLDSLCISLNKKLRHSRVQSFLSGSTGVIVMLHAGKIIAANVGDSRAIILAKKENGSKALRVIEITRDHTPFLDEERRRIEKCGGEVKRIIGNY